MKIRQNNLAKSKAQHIREFGFYFYKRNIHENEMLTGNKQTLTTFLSVINIG